MSLTIVVARERAAGERRVATVPVVAEKFAGLGASVVIERGAGSGCRIPDTAYTTAGLADESGLAGQADVVLAVQQPPPPFIAGLRPGTVVVGFLAPHREPERIRALQQGGITSFAMELVPRISRAQSMDALSSQAAVAGYRAALIAAQSLGRFFPMLTTAAGTIRPAKVLVIGAGVAGLQAIATARRLGAQVEAYDVRSATREQVESLGTRFVDTGVAADAAGGYARELTEEEVQKQQDALARHIAQADAVISTAAVPGRPAPKIISAAMVDAMKAGAVIVDLAAETGGNCELTRAGEDFMRGEVRICGPLNVPSSLAEHASEMYARNLFNFLSPAIKEGALAIDWDDEVYRASVLTHDGKIMYEAARKLVENR